MAVVPVAHARVVPKRPSLLTTEHLVVWAAAAVLFFLVGIPVAFLVGRSFLVSGALSWAAYAEVMSRSLNYQALLNTLWIGLGSATLAVIFGTPIAWAIGRTNMPFREGVRTLAYAAYLSPPFLLAIAYVILAAPNTGALNRLVVALFGVQRGPFNAYTLPTLIFVTGLHTYPTLVLLVASALESVDASLEQAARILGVGRWRTTLRVTLPLVLPSILTGALLAFVNAIALFGSQAILGIPGRFYTLPTRVYQVLGYPPDYALASALSVLLVLLTVLALAVQRRWLGDRAYARIGGKGNPTDRLDLGRWRWALLALCGLVSLVAIGLPYGALGTVSIMRSWPRGLVADNLTLDNFLDVLFRLDLTRRALINSLGLGVVSATVAMVLGSVVAYTNGRATGGRRARTVLDYLSLIPLGVPGIVLAVALLQFWLNVPLVNLYGTYAILALAYITRFVPLAVRSVHVAFGQVDTALEEAARIGGRSWLATLWRITVPLARPGLIAGWILVFVPMLQELSASVLLFTSDTITLAVATLNLQENGKFETVSALGIVMVVLTSICLYFARRAAGGPIGGQAPT
jgi:iron(III) transport system permease protein